MRRRAFIAALGSATVWSVVARAQQPAMPVVGYLYMGTPEGGATVVAAFLKGLSEAGFVEGRNVAIEYRFVRNEFDRLPELVADLLRRQVAVIASPASEIPALAAKTATGTVPIVFGGGVDPVGQGVVASLARPGGNVTGVSYMSNGLAAKRLGLLQELIPRAARFAFLVDPRGLDAEVQIKDAQAAALAIGRQFEVLTARTNRDIDTAFANLVQNRADALLLSPSGFFANRLVQIVTLAARHAVPAIYTSSRWPEAGGLMSYGANQADLYRQVGIYTGRILKGERPADLPIMRAVKFELIINLQTAKTIGIEVPETLLATADEVIQ